MADHPIYSNLSRPTKKIHDDYGTIAGGGGNLVGSDNGASDNQKFGTIGGGKNNMAGYEFASIVGGSGNTAGGYAATIFSGLSS